MKLKMPPTGKPFPKQRQKAFDPKPCDVGSYVSWWSRDEDGRQVSHTGQVWSLAPHGGVYAIPDGTQRAHELPRGSFTPVVGTRTAQLAA